MDLPDLLDDWSWNQQSISSLDNIVAFYLEEPSIPDWDSLKSYYPACGGGEDRRWICKGDEYDWTIFEVERGQWVFVKKGSFIGPKVFSGGVYLIDQIETENEKKWVYYSPVEIESIKESLLFFYNQKVDSFESKKTKNDVWNFKGEMGRLTFEEKGKSVILIHTIIKN